ncbi:MAG: hypothetical protein QM528_07555 [Phycisphaerales bacterium]|nr:hypothetical protein [Phycisphaerales bacterium]
MKAGINLRNVTIILLMVVAVILRLVMPMNHYITAFTNFSPLGAMALFGGTYFKTRIEAILFPLITIFVGDILINKFVMYNHWVFFYSGAFWTYLSFVLMALVGYYLQSSKNVIRFGISILSIVFIHWIVSDIGVWISGTTYPLTYAGWVECLTMAIPFEKNFFIGSLLYSALLFGGFEYLQTKIPILQYANQSVSKRSV